MKKQIIFIITLFVLNTPVLYAEKLASVLSGKIISRNLAGVEIIMKESDNSILDMTDTTPTGSYKLDLTIMDTPSRTEVDKLIIEIKSKTGIKKKVNVKDYMRIFDDTVLLNPIILN